MCKIVLTNVYVFVAGEILYISFYQITEYKYNVCVEEAFYMNQGFIKSLHEYTYNINK
jgi:hypothetical protein